MDRTSSSFQAPSFFGMGVATGDVEESLAPVMGPEKHAPSRARIMHGRTPARARGGRIRRYPAQTCLQFFPAPNRRGRTSEASLWSQRGYITAARLGRSRSGIASWATRPVANMHWRGICIRPVRNLYKDRI